MFSKILNKILTIFYAGKHPQQKYYKNLYRMSEDRFNELEKERIQKDNK